MNEELLKEIVSHFAIEGEWERIETMGAGFINDTLKVCTKGEAPDYILQRKNHSIFPDVPAMMDNIVAVNPKAKDAETIIHMCTQISRGIGHNCPASLIQLAVAELIDETSDLSVYEKNRDILYKELLDLGFECVKPEGTFYIFPKALEEDAKAFCEKAWKYNLALVPGDSFGCPGYFRIAYCVKTDMVERSLGAFRALAEEYGKVGK